jgi:hypothetical protein
MRFRCYVSTAALTLMLSACLGGGGGGGGGTLPFKAFSDVTAGKTYQMEARTLSVDYTADPIDGTVDAGATEANAATFEFSLDDIGDYTKARLAFEPDPGFSTPNEIDFRTSDGDAFDDGDILDPVAGDYIIAAGGDFDKIAILSDHSAMGFEYQTFGVWLTGVETGTGLVATMTAGAPTLSTSVPESGVANYSGASSGIYIDAGDNPFLAFADFTAQVEFDAPARIDVQASNTEVVDLNALVPGTPNPALDYAGSGAVAADGTFSAAISATNLAGDMDGLLYGPSAEELGAVFQMSGTDGRYIGAVGAAQ